MLKRRLKDRIGALKQRRDKQTALQQQSGTERIVRNQAKVGTEAGNQEFRQAEIETKTGYKTKESQIFEPAKNLLSSPNKD